MTHEHLTQNAPFRGVGIFCHSQWVGERAVFSCGTKLLPDRPHCKTRSRRFVQNRRKPLQEIWCSQIIIRAESEVIAIRTISDIQKVLVG